MGDDSEKAKIDLIFASDIMSEHVITVKDTDSIGEVAHIMLREKISGYPVINEEGQIVGIITMTDMYKLLDQMVADSRAMPEGTTIGDLPHQIRVAKEKPISAITIKDIKTITPETPLSDIIDDVVDHRIHTFPVVKDNKLVGIIGRHDVINAVFRYG